MKAQKQMGILSHLEELRKRLVIVFIVFLAATIASLYFSSRILDNLIKLANGYHFIYAEPSQLMVQHVKIAMICGLIISLPVMLYELLAFLYPALKKKEKHIAAILLGMGLVFFGLGIMFADKVMIPLMLKFFLSMNINPNIDATITIESYVSFLSTMFITFGIVFEMPTILAAFTRFGVLKVRWLLKGQKYVILIILVVAALITPPDVISQIMVAIPLFLLYEISIAICYVIDRKKN